MVLPSCTELPPCKELELSCPIAKLVPPKRTATVETVINLLARIFFVSFCWKVRHGRSGVHAFSRTDTSARWLLPRIRGPAG